ncbi:MAG TPA: oxygenase MpaB family protein [Rhizomicrobium sp.]|nr:oxygenase MpaB family protein [Rhizomicrobium sp.]
MNIADLSRKIADQATLLPAMYGRVDFSATPERFTVEPDAQTVLEGESAKRRPELLAHEERVARIKTYTMLGDIAADSYAALMPEFGFRGLVTMLEAACDHGLETIPSAPPELARFIQEMERLPAWLDMGLIEQGARIERNAYAHRAPFVVRGGFIATFMNKYSALPMALTGSLSNQTAARRVKETATFFTTTVMPGALRRHGAAFKAAAMVRLMHAMVRFNVLRRGNQWDVKTYGIPIPQVDQMPAGMISIFLLSQRLLRQGRTEFTPAERARVELARYRCFLLGLPEDLLADTPQAIVDILLTRHATLRKGFDHNCSALVAATMAADLKPDGSVPSRLHAWLERGFAKLYFVSNFMRGDKQAAARVGVRLGIADYIGAVAAGILITARMTAYTIAAHIPVVCAAADRSLVRKLSKQLARYGHAEFTTNAEAYRPVHT